VLAALPAAQPALPVAAVSGSPGLFSPAELVDFQRRTAVAGDAAVRAALLRSMIDAAASLPTMYVLAPPTTYFHPPTLTRSPRPPATLCTARWRTRRWRRSMAALC